MKGPAQRGGSWLSRLQHLRVGQTTFFSVLLLVSAAACLGIHRIRDTIDHLAHRQFDAVDRRDGGMFSPAALVFHAQRQTGGRVLQVELTARADRAVRMRVAMPYGDTVVAYMDPYTADLRGTERDAGLVAAFDPFAGAGSDTPGSDEDLCTAEAPGPPAPGRAAITLDDAVDEMERAGLSPPFTVVLPQGPGGFYRARTHPNLGRSARIVDIDASDGQRLRDSD